MQDNPNAGDSPGEAEDVRDQGVVLIHDPTRRSRTRVPGRLRWPLAWPITSGRWKR